MTDKAKKRGGPRPSVGQNEVRINARAAKVVAVLMVLYMLGVAGFFVYDHPL